MNWRNFACTKLMRNILKYGKAYAKLKFRLKPFSFNAGNDKMPAFKSGKEKKKEDIGGWKN